MEQNTYFESVTKQFEYYKLLGEKTFSQVPDDMLFWKFNKESNSIANIVNHLSGNMRSRWIDFLISDGEKEWRDRDAEFEDFIMPRFELLHKWNEGWDALLGTLRSLNESDMTKVVYIRNEPHSVIEAINRQLAHYSYHVGQIVFIGKMSSQNWSSLTIPKGGSKVFNAEKLGKSTL